MLGASYRPVIARSIRRPMIRYAIVIAIVAAFSPLRAQEARVVPDSFHLRGARVVVYQPMAGFAVKERVLITGIRMARGCSFSSHGPGVAGWMEWVVEYDVENCLQVRARGPGEPPRITPNGQHREAHFSLQMDTAAMPASEELRIRVCATLIEATDAPCNGSMRAARLRSSAALRVPGGAPELRGDTLTIPGEIHVTLASGDEAAFASLADSEFLHVEVFAGRGGQRLFRATGRAIAVRRSPQNGQLEIAAHW